MYKLKFIKIKYIGATKTAIKDPREEYLLIIAITIHIIKNDKPMYRFIPNKKPIQVATPLPPLNFNQMGKI